MKITGLETYSLSAPLPQVVRTSTHAITQVSEVIVKLTTDTGLVGIGEAHGPFLFQGAEGLRTVNTVLKTITPLVIGQDPFDVERIWQDLFALTYRSVRGIPSVALVQRYGENDATFPGNYTFHTVNDTPDKITNKRLWLKAAKLTLATALDLARGGAQL